ncbi:ribosome maturation protein [Dipodascopsis uninucleata]
MSLVSKVVYRGSTDVFEVLILSPDHYKRYMKDHSIPLVNIVASFKIFVSQRGVLNEASNAAIENEFGNISRDEAISNILERGEFQESSKPMDENSYRSRNDTYGPRIAH